jgi:hypothetical protein
MVSLDWALIDVATHEPNKEHLRCFKQCAPPVLIYFRHNGPVNLIVYRRLLLDNIVLDVLDGTELLIEFGQFRFAIFELAH